MRVLIYNTFLGKRAMLSRGATYCWLHVVAKSAMFIDIITNRTVYVF